MKSLLLLGSFVYGQEDAPQNSRISQIACGYRHSMVIIEYDAVRTASDCTLHLLSLPFLTFHSYFASNAFYLNILHLTLQLCQISNELCATCYLY